MKENVPNYVHEFEISLIPGTSTVRKLDVGSIFLPGAVLRTLPKFSRVNFVGQIQTIGSVQQAKQKKTDTLLAFVAV